MWTDACWAVTKVDYSVGQRAALKVVPRAATRVERSVAPMADLSAETKVVRTAALWA